MSQALVWIIGAAMCTAIVVGGIVEGTKIGNAHHLNVLKAKEDLIKSGAVVCMEVMR